VNQWTEWAYDRYSVTHCGKCTSDTWQNNYYISLVLKGRGSFFV
jgi:hypothetical protein